MRFYGETLWLGDTRRVYEELIDKLHTDVNETRCLFDETECPLKQSSSKFQISWPKYKIYTKIGKHEQH